MITIGTRNIGPGQPCFIIAEIGQNHQGDVYLASRMVQQAEKIGVDAVKFCKRDIASELTPEAFNKPYDNEHSFGKTYGEHRLALELSVEQYKHLALRHQYNNNRSILFSTACDTKSVDDLEEVGFPLYKVASRDVDNLPLLERIAATRKPVIISSGMSDLREVAEAVNTVLRWHDQIVLMHCTSEYPTPLEHVNLRCIETLQREFGLPVGLSDHTPGIQTSVAAVAMGACAIEKHFTLSRAMKGRDHAASLEPKGLEMLVEWIRNIETAMGDGVKVPAVGTVEARQRLGRSLVAKVPIHPGTQIEQAMLELRCPGDGIKWSERSSVIGRVSSREIEAGEKLTLEMLASV